MYNTMLQKLEYQEKDAFCSFSTYREYTEDIENFELWGCIFGHVIGIRYLPNKFNEKMNKSGFYNKVFFTHFSDLILQYPDLSTEKFVIDEFDISKVIAQKSIALEKKQKPKTPQKHLLAPRIVI